MNKTELIVALDGLRWDIHQWKISEKNANYYDDVLSEVCQLLVDLDE